MEIELNNKNIDLKENENLVILNINSYYLEQLMLMNDILFTCNFSHGSFNFRKKEQNMISKSIDNKEEEKFFIENISLIIEEKIINFNTEDYSFIIEILKNIEKQKDNKCVVIYTEEKYIDYKVIKNINKLSNEKNINTIWFIKNSKFKYKYTDLFKHRIKKEEDFIFNGIKLNYIDCNNLNFIHSYGRKINKLKIEIDTSLYKDLIKIIDFENYKIEFEKNKLLNKLENF